MADSLNAQTLSSTFRIPIGLILSARASYLSLIHIYAQKVPSPSTTALMVTEPSAVLGLSLIHILERTADCFTSKNYLQPTVLSIILKQLAS